VILLNKNKKSIYGCSCHSFTLVELMTVIVIIGVILGITIPAFNGFLGRSSVDAATSMVAAELRIARAQAAQRRTEVGVAFLDKGTAFQAFYEKSTNVFEWLPGSKKEFLPKGALVPLSETSLTLGSYTIAGTAAISGILFQKNGVPETSGANIKIYEAVLDAGGNVLMLNPNSHTTLTLNNYSGIVKITKE